MLHTAGLPMSYWEFAVLTACYLNNRTYHSGVDGIPVTLATGVTPDLSHLRIFGCPAYVHIPANQRKKMADTAFKGVLVGYPTDTYGYLVYNPQTRRVITTRHVRFDETFAGRLSEEGEIVVQQSTQTSRPPPPVSDYDSDDDFVTPTNPPDNFTRPAPTTPITTPNPSPRAIHIPAPTPSTPDMPTGTSSGQSHPPPEDTPTPSEATPSPPPYSGPAANTRSRTTAAQPIASRLRSAALTSVDHDNHPYL